MNSNILMPWMVAGLVMVVAFIAHSYFFDLGTIHALRGYSILEYWAQVTFPDNFERDFSGGAGMTNASVITTLYPLIVNLSGLSVLTVQYMMIALEVVVFSSGALMLWCALSTRLSLRGDMVVYGGIWLLAVLMLSHMIRPNLGNFSFPYFHGQFYGFADGLRLMAVAFALSRRWVFLTLCLCVGFMIHPIKIIMAGGFIAGIVIIDWRRSVTFTSVIAGFLTVCFMAVWAVLWLRVGGEVNQVITVEDFVAYSRVFQVHWYPVDYGLFDTRHHVGISPFIAVIIMAWLSLKQCQLCDVRYKQLITGGAVLLFLTALGVWISWVGGNTSLIRLSLLRASTLLTLLAPFVMMAGLIIMWQKQAWHWVAIYSVFFVAGFEGTTQISVIMAVFAIMLYVYEQKTYPRALISLCVIAVMMTAWFGLTVPEVKNGFVLGGQRLVFTVLGFGLLLLIARVPVWLRLGLAVPQARVVAVTVLFLLCACFWSYGTRLKSDVYLQQASAYQQAQFWARENTRIDALFMVDPCVYYGWRDYSHRSSLGTPREWYLTAWGYTGDRDGLEQGKAIGRSLGLEMQNYLPQLGQRSQVNTQTICQLASDLYYDPSLKNIRAIAQHFAVDYFVMQESKLERIQDWPTIQPVFANEFYAIYSAEEILR